jgi:Na+-driven multidrug efflux pump
MLVTGIYNAADTFFVGRISTQATAAVGLVFSVMALIQAVGFFCGQGSGSYISRLLGAGRRQEADETAATGFALSLILGVAAATLIKPSFILISFQRENFYIEYDITKRLKIQELSSIFCIDSRISFKVSLYSAI